MIKVQVLMSTYNGEKYLREQIDSILSQEGVKACLLVRDDGSKDNTINILKEYRDIEIIEGHNVGVYKSFFELINKSGDYGYYSFADQDDVWDRDKLRIAIDMLDGRHDIPSVYASNTRLVDADLNFIKNEEDNPKTTLGSAFVKNFCTGCTMVFNAKLMNKLRYNLPSYVPMHDWWVNLVCLSIGGLSIYDTKPHMDYRQHGENIYGAESGMIAKLRNRWKKFLNKPYHRDIMAKELLSIYENDINNEEFLILYAMANPNLHLLYDSRIKTSNLMTDLLFSICIALKKI